MIGLAVVIGIVLLQQVDNDARTNVGASPTTAAKRPKTTTTVAGPAPTTVTTAPTPPKDASQVRLIVLNGGAASGEAGRLSTDLKGKGYTNQPQTANNWTGRNEQGNTVFCKPGLQREAVILAGVIGNQTKVAAYPATPPSVIDTEVDCIVAVGS